MKTIEVEFLKNNWKGDPCWDIEDTEGFEDHYYELKAFRLEMEQKWASERFNEIDRRATELKCSMELAEYIIGLEKKLDNMRDEMYKMGYRND